MAILSQTKMPEESWTFLKWWSSTEVQSRFGNLLQSTYGSEYIWPTANREAFESLPLKAKDKKVILEQLIDDMRLSESARSREDEKGKGRDKGKTAR